MRHPVHIACWLPSVALAALLLAPPTALAATISSVSIVRNAGNTADLFDDVGDVITAAQSTVAVSSSSATGFTTRYAAVVSADRGGDPGPSGTTTQDFTGDFSITFDVTETAGVAWAVVLDVMRVGAQTIISDGSGSAAVAFGLLDGSESGAGSITSGTQDLAALATLDNSGPGGRQSEDTPFSQTANAVLSGVGTGFAQAVVLNYTFTASATTVDPGTGQLQGDEAALRMGLNSALSQFSADDYPGTGGRVILGDGIFLVATLLDSPEPNTALLFGLGLGLLARRARRRRGA